MATWWRWAVVLAVVCHVAVAQNLVHFYVDVNKKTCFYKDLAQDVVLFGKYKMEISNEPDSQSFYTPRDKLHTGVLIDIYEVFAGNKQLVHLKGKPLGQFTFDTLDSGQHMICITPRSFYRKWSAVGASDPIAIHESKFKRARISLDFEVGDSFLVDSSFTGDVQQLTNRVKKLNDKLSDIKQEQLFIKMKEELFRDLSESTNVHVWQWSVFQFWVFLIMGMYQLLTLQRFFIKEKID
ncbi:emp24p/erv25p- protein [Yamadazyma tenuis]|uniref:GOLD domain-containing protein n=1 Tax=Candida tenuis (strain ATCC 10573 / BCRC 21748 / CBS 615 / JCM 9827 / NBRC 10315 / NRRL Y-1498 / VKM Y-70) TaxID=590646 RepID=G3B567_CANTC|nr:uncharacterized protein CANTEDRAFT_114471 [Yamadazyma tenuis ATCC 10573]EGV63152.1 hypothetical protein CANTEDRAFT_114471 [Yamadazyma tenuis ATCC 10573]WEJ97031.1 emp24p/erv25p- protein [Yamadazyma tenuis]